MVYAIILGKVNICAYAMTDGMEGIVKVSVILQSLASTGYLNMWEKLYLLHEITLRKQQQQQQKQKQQQ